jgi:hypothetical protein
MGRAEGVAVSQVKTAGSRRRGSLSLIPGGAEPPCWTAPTLERLTRALDLRPTGFGRYEVTAAEARWPAFPAALLPSNGVAPIADSAGQRQASKRSASDSNCAVRGVGAYLIAQSGTRPIGVQLGGSCVPRGVMRSRRGGSDGRLVA